jgi:hypothetical protein
MVIDVKNIRPVEAPMEYDAHRADEDNGESTEFQDETRFGREFRFFEEIFEDDPEHDIQDEGHHDDVDEQLEVVGEGAAHAGFLKFPDVHPDSKRKLKETACKTTSRDGQGHDEGAFQGGKEPIRLLSRLFRIHSTSPLLSSH